MSLIIGAIKVPFDPFIFGGATTAFSWHGFLTFVAVATAIWFAGKAADREKLNKEQVYNTALWGVIAGIIGARLIHVIDFWGDYADEPLQMLAVWQGGIGLWGGIIGGWIGGLIYGYFAKVEIGRFMDIAAVPLLIAQTIGRVGDIINGEHWSRPLDQFWGWYFTDIDSPAQDAVSQRSEIITDAEMPVHPAVVYEMIANIAIIGLLYVLRGRLRPAGSLFMVYLALYAVARFSIQFIRLDDVKFWGLQEAHLIAICVMLVTVPFLIWRTRLIAGPRDWNWRSPIKSLRLARQRSAEASQDGDRVNVGRERRRRQRQQARSL